MLLRGDQDVLRVFPDADERARLDVMELSVFDKMLDRLARGGEALDFVEDDAGTPRNQLDDVDQFEAGDQVCNAVRLFERLSGVARPAVGLREVDEDVRIVLGLGESFDEMSLARPSRAFDEQRIPVSQTVLPSSAP